MKSNIRIGGIVWLVVFAFLALTAEEVARYRLKAHSQALIQMSNRPLPPWKSLMDQAMNYEDKLIFPDDELLTVEETIGLVYCGYHKHLMIRATPSASQELWRIIQKYDDGIAEFHAAAFGILGFVGNDADAARMVDGLQSYSGLLNYPAQLRLRAIIAGLGRMGLRGVSTAIKSLDEMSDVSYWKGRLKWVPDDLVGDYHLPPEFESVCCVFRAKALWRYDEWPPKFKDMLAAIPSEKHRRRVAEEFDLNRMREAVGAGVLLLGSKKASDAERLALCRTYERRDQITKSTSQMRHEIWNRLPLWQRPKPGPL